MSTRTQALRRPPITFAHRGAMDRAPENSIEAFGLALALGASGLESDVWITADGEIALDHDGELGRWPRKQRFADVPRSALPGHVPTLDELYAACGTGFELSLDVKDPDAFERVVDVARAAGPDATARLWLCHPEPAVLRTWRRSGADFRLVNSARVSRIAEGVRQRAVNLAADGIDAANMHWLDWSEVYVSLFHVVDVHAFGWDVQTTSTIEQLMSMGIDAVYSDHVDRMAAAVRK